MDAQIHVENLAIALRVALEKIADQERAAGYYKDSGMVASWRECLTALDCGDQIKVVR